MSRCEEARRRVPTDTPSRDLTDMLSRNVGAKCCFVSTPAKCRRRTSRSRHLLNWAKLSSGLGADRRPRARMAQRGPVSHYRLSRDEYANVVYDLVAVHFDARMPGALNEDPRRHGFDRIGSMLSLKRRMTRYLRGRDGSEPGLSHAAAEIFEAARDSRGSNSLADSARLASGEY